MRTNSIANQFVLDALGNLKIKGAFRLTVSTIANLPASPAAGWKASVSDGDAALAWGATAVNSGAGATYYEVGHNGTNWTVTGK